VTKNTAMVFIAQFCCCSIKIVSLFNFSNGLLNYLLNTDFRIGFKRHTV